MALAVGLAAQDLTVPNKPKDTLKFAVIGDSGTGDSNQYRLAKVFTDIHQRFPYEFVLMMGDNMYGGESARDFQRKFEIPYKPVLDKNVKFYASLGNHDSTNQRMYKLFNMNGERFYTFRPKAGVRFFALDSNYMDRTQLQWLEKELAASGSDWKIMYFHHPIYSSGGTARIGHGIARSARTAVPEVRRRRRAGRSRALLRTAEAAEGHSLLHFRAAPASFARATSAGSSPKRRSTRATTS